MPDNNIIWSSSHKCDFCQKDCGKVLYDAATKYGPWATMCEDCWKKQGAGVLGPGFGQRYELNDLENQKYIKSRRMAR